MPVADRWDNPPVKMVSTDPNARTWWDKFVNGADAPTAPTIGNAPAVQPMQPVSNTPVQQVLQALATSVPQGYTVGQAPTQANALQAVNRTVPQGYAVGSAPTVANAVQAQGAQIGSYNDADYQAREAQALDYIKNQLGFDSGVQGAADAYYASGKTALDKSLTDQRTFNESDAARRGLFNSGVLTDNQNKAYEGYNKGLGELGNSTAQYKQQMSAADQAIRQNAAQAIMNYKPASYAQWQQQNEANVQQAGAQNSNNQQWQQGNLDAALQGWAAQNQANQNQWGAQNDAAAAYAQQQNANNQAWQQGNLDAALQGWAAQNTANANQWGAQNDANSAYAAQQNAMAQAAAQQNNANQMAQWQQGNTQNQAQWQAMQDAAMQQWLLQQQLAGQTYGANLTNWQNRPTGLNTVMGVLGGAATLAKAFG